MADTAPTPALCLTDERSTACCHKDVSRAVVSKWFYNYIYNYTSTGIGGPDAIICIVASLKNKINFIKEIY